MKTNQLYPIAYDNKLYYKKDCHPVFIAFYTSREALQYDGSVYIANGTSIFPTGNYVP